MSNLTEQCAIACRLAARQHALATREQLAAAGISPYQIYDWQQTGFLTRVDTGVFLVAGGRLHWSAKVLSACLATGGLASHRSAAALHGLGAARRGRPEITVALEQPIRRTSVTVHRSTDLDRITPVLVDGIPTTPVARTVLDLGAVAPFAVEDAARDAVARRLTTWQELLSTLVAHSRKGRRGCGPLRAVLDQWYGDQSESRLEVRLLQLMRLARLPIPQQQVDVFDEHGFVMRLDVGYPDLKIGIEADSVRHHDNPVAFEEDRRKRNRLAAAGWLVLQITHRQMNAHPTLVCEEIARAIATRTTAVLWSAMWASPT